MGPIMLKHHRDCPYAQSLVMQNGLHDGLLAGESEKAALFLEQAGFCPD
jgi:hypothetical protein